MNSSYNRAVLSAVQKLAGTYNTDTMGLITGTVVSVDEDAGTCLVEAVTGKATTQMDGVELQTVIADGLLFVPKVGSEVKVLYSTYTTPFIVQYGDLDKIVIASETSIDIFCDDIKFNDGTFKGLVKVVELTKKLNAIEKDINKLKQAFTSWTPVPQDGGAALKGATSSWSGQQITETQQGDIENLKIQH